MLKMNAVEELHKFYTEVLAQQYAQARLKRTTILPVRIHWFMRERVRQPIREIIDQLRQRSTVEATLKSAWTTACFPRVRGATAKFGAGYWRRRRDYIYHEEIILLHDVLERAFAPDDAADLKDKRRSTRRFESAGLPHIPILSEFENGVEKIWTTDRQAWEQDLFSKPVDLWSGLGAAAWRFENGRYGHFDLQNFKLQLGERSRNGVLIVQPKLCNHPKIERMAGSGLSTARIVTVQRSEREFDIAAAVFRMPKNDAVADNFSAGGIGAPIEIHTGTLGPGVVKEWGSCNHVRTHPDTGMKIEGFQLPVWAEAKQLALEAHHEFASMPTVGWDIAFTRNGIVLVEGNAGWGVDLLQMAHRAPLADTMIPEVLARYVRKLKAGEVGS